MGGGNWPLILKLGYTMYKKPPKIFCDVRCGLTTWQLTLLQAATTIYYWVTWH